ncbi:GtrA family protein [Acidovorax sp. sif1233]|uniref:GtrA family protein n=1 Tax=Acidovorax sp. sif1233 TaxID=2854792 RepID=UPI0021024C5A|nr:GtrA family protein [Acidovorax sp. sif1233]
MLRRELTIFLVVGVTTVILDFLTYRSIVALELTRVEMAKTIGFLAGTLFAYFANRIWTFGHKPKVSGTMWRFAMLYAGTLLANVVVNSLMLKFFRANTFVINIAFIVATGFSACLNFLGMKFFVFRSRTAGRPQ